jgi:hypothetical protein
MINGNVITGNTAGFSGGGIWSNGIVVNNLILENTSTLGWGGGIYGEAQINNNLISGNEAVKGGGISTGTETALNSNMVNNTIIGNYASLSGGGIDSHAGLLNIMNSILWNNHAVQRGPEVDFDGTRLVMNFSDVMGGQASVYAKYGSVFDWGSGMIESDPLFVDALNGDFHLTFNSPCKDHGDNTVVTELYDFEGDPRIAYGTVDMGADEFYPHLYYTGDATPSGAIQAKLVGLPGTLINGVIMGVNIFDPPLPCDYGLWYMDDPMQIITGLGTIPANGVYVMPGTVPAAPAGPYTIYLQAAIDSWLTNLCTVNVE